MGMPMTQPMGGMPPQQMRGMPPQPMMMPGQPPMNMPHHMMMPPQAQMTPQQQYLHKGMLILPAVVKSNPNYKNQVGEAIFEYVEKLAGEQKAPKITGMLI